MKFRRAVGLVTDHYCYVGDHDLLQAQSAATKQGQNVRYKLFDLGTFGAPQSYVKYSGVDRVTCCSLEAGMMRDLGTLAGFNSALLMTLMQEPDCWLRFQQRPRLLTDSSERAFLMARCGEVQAGAPRCEVVQGANVAALRNGGGFNQLKQSNLRGDPGLRLRPQSGVLRRVARFVLVAKS